MSQFQLIPYDRIKDYFADQLGIPVSVGSVFNFNKEAFSLLEGFDDLVKNKLVSSALLHSDETGINVNGKKFWLHSASNRFWTYFSPHKKRGMRAMNAIGVLPFFIRNTFVMIIGSHIIDMIAPMRYAMHTIYEN